MTHSYQYPGSHILFLSPVKNYTITVSENTSVSVNCSVLGTPPLSISFVRVGQNGSIPLDDIRVSIAHSETNESSNTTILVSAQLTIESTHDGDSDNYACIAKNKIGNAWRNFELIVHGEHRSSFKMCNKQFLVTI